MDTLESAPRALKTWQRVVIYFALLVVLVAISVTIDFRFHLGVDRSTAITGGALFLVTATGRPWWLFDTIRRVRWFALISSDHAMRWVLAVLGLVLILVGLSVTSSSNY
jgi:hypothetical protein